MRILQGLLLCSAAATLVLLSGCSDKRAEVSGTVQLDGQPVPDGRIDFIPVEGTKGPGTGAPIKDGHYHIAKKDGVVVGKNRVELRTFRKTGEQIQDPNAPQGVLTDERAQAFPPEYSDQSTVVKEIHEGPNTIDFDVQTKKD